MKDNQDEQSSEEEVKRQKMKGKEAALTDACILLNEKVKKKKEKVKKQNRKGKTAALKDNDVDDVSAHDVDVIDLDLDDDDPDMVAFREEEQRDIDEYERNMRFRETHPGFAHGVDEFVRISDERELELIRKRNEDNKTDPNPDPKTKTDPPQKII
jgi:hypothetical protein